MSKTQEELERLESLDKDGAKEAFDHVIQLAIRSGETEIRDYLHAMKGLILDSLENHISLQVTPEKIIVEPEPLEVTPDMVTPSAFFNWSMNIETCCFSSPGNPHTIPRRVVGKGIFMTRDYKYKWCEDCATAAHKQHPNYLKYRK